MKLSLIIPVHNDEARVGRCLERLIGHVRANRLDAEILVCEDGSTDGTVSVVRSYEAQVSYPRIVLLSHPRRLGKGFGLRRGVMEASGECCILTDVDLPVSLGKIGEAVSLLEAGADLVLGLRVARDEPPVRRFLSHGFHILVRILFNLKFDTQCGFKALRADAARRLFSDLKVGGWAFDVDLAYRAVRGGMKVVELPVDWRYSRESSFRLRYALRMFLDIVSLWFNAILRKGKPDSGEVALP